MFFYYKITGQHDYPNPRTPKESMTRPAGFSKPNGAPEGIPRAIRQSIHKPQPCPPGFLQRFASHKVAPAIVNYTAGALAFAGAALFFTGFGTLPGIILMSVGTALFLCGTALSTCNLPADIDAGDYIQFSGQCFVWGLCFVFTLPTIVLLNIAVHFSFWWLLQDTYPADKDHPFSSDLSWLLAPPTKDTVPDAQAFSGLEVA